MIRKKLMLLSLILLASNLFSQKMITKKLEWAACDSNRIIAFKDTNQILVWGKTLLPFSNAYLKDIQMKNCMFKILIVIGCSGLPCLEIILFKENLSLFMPKLVSNARLTEELLIEVNKEQEKVIFRTKSSQLGELSFYFLNCL